MKEIKAPEGVLRLIQQMGEQEEKPIAVSSTDLNPECKFAPGYLALTEKALYVFTAEIEEGAVQSFKGYKRKQDVEKENRREWSCKRIDLKDLKDLRTEAQVSIGTLVAEYNDGECFTIAVFSNLYRKSVHMLTREFSRLKGPKEGEEGKPEGELSKHGFGGRHGHGGPGGPGGFGGHGGPGGPPPFGFGGPGGHGPHGEEDESEQYCPKCGRMYPNPERKICPHCSDKRSIFKRMFRYFRPYYGLMGMLLLIYVLIAVLNLIYPYLNGTVLYDNVLRKNDAALMKYGIKHGEYLTALLLIILAMFLSRLLSQVGGMISGVITAKIVSNVVRDVKKSIFSAMSDLSISFFKNRQTGTLMTRVLGDAERVTGFFIDEFPYMFIHGFSILAAVTMMFMINWKMAIATCILMPISVLYSNHMRPRFWTAFGHRHRAERTVNNRVNDNLTGARVVKAFGQGEKEVDRFKSANTYLTDAQMGIVRLNNRTSFVFQFTNRIARFFIWLIGAYFILNKGYFELGVLITFVGYVDQMERPLDFLTNVFRDYTDTMNAAQRMFEIIDAIPEIREAEKPVHMDSMKGHIEIRNMTFGYEINRPILKNINLDIPEGTMLGIVGRSGAGKTTLVNLISRMYEPQEGEILIDGVNIREIAMKDLRRNVAMVSQETYIFMGTIEENIAYAKPGATKSEIIRAAKLASAHDFILKMPDGYNTVVGSSGRGLSGGERQRISIARAILANPKILILDEATASVDTETERAIQESINYLIKDRTTISIAHRLSTLRDADFLCVIDNGEITEKGTHGELAALKGTYYKLMELQTKALALKE